MNALTPIATDNPLVDHEGEIDLYDEASGFEHSGTAGFNIETSGGGHYSRDIEHNAKIAWMHIGRALLGRADLIGIFGKEAIEKAEAAVTAHYDNLWR